MTEPQLTQERLQEILRYDSQTGEFRWLVRKGSNTCVGDIAGSPARSAYWRINVDGHPYRAHQLAWLYMEGDWGRPLIDHRDGDPFNNRWDNLRLASHADNAANRRRSPRKASGFKGVSFEPRTSKWYAQITHQGRRYRLGYFETPEAAHAAYVAKARELFGEFARAK